MTDDRHGIKNPISNAYIEACASGANCFSIPRSSVKRYEYINFNAGDDSAKPKMIAGITNMRPYSSTIEVIPSLLKPTMRMMPISRVFVSTLIIRSE